MTTNRGGKIEGDPRWKAVVARDRAQDGTFCNSVTTTGVYHHPSCGARRPNPTNVYFHRTGEEAERAGFLPCKRCKRDQSRLEKRHAATIAEACRFIEAAGSTPRLA